MKRILWTLLPLILLPLLLWGATWGLHGTAERNAQKAHIRLMETLLPGGKGFYRVDYIGEDAAIRSVHQCDKGYVIETAAYGYADEITVYVGLDNQGKVMGLVVYEAHETAGLGSRVLTDHVFLSQFLNQSGSFTVGTVQEDAFSGATSDSSASWDREVAVDGISGATVSSKAVARCVNAAVAYVTGSDADSSATEWGG